MADTGESGAAETATPPAAESASGSGTAIMSTIGAHPSITIFTFWQGILEIVVRAIGIVAAFICLIIAAIVLDDLDGGTGGLVDRSNAACGFLVFLAIMVMLLEGIIIALRFLNFDIVNKFITIFHIADIAISMVFAVIFFCLAIATAVYAKDFDDLTQLSSIVDNIRDELGIASFFCFMELFLFAGLAAFMGISFMLKWRNVQANYAATPTAVEGGPN